jgi:hypothetical protein
MGKPQIQVKVEVKVEVETFKKFLTSTFISTCLISPPPGAGS